MKGKSNIFNILGSSRIKFAEGTFILESAYHFDNLNLNLDFDPYLIIVTPNYEVPSSGGIDGCIMMKGSAFPPFNIWSAYPNLILENRGSTKA